MMPNGCTKRMENFFGKGPRISIVVPTLNRKLLIGECVCSVLAQDYRNWELIIVDDNSTDGTQEYLEQLSRSDRRISFLLKDGERGAPASRNLGLKAARGEYVIFLDSDDVLAPFCLSQRIEYMSGNNDLDFAIFPQLVFREHPGDLSRLVNIPTDEDDLSRFLTIGQNVDVPWINGGPIWKRESLESFGVCWSESVVVLQDIQIHTDAIISGMKYEYAKNALPDSYWRMYEGERVSGQIATKTGIDSHEKFFFGMWERICSSGLSREKYRIRIFKCIYFLCLADTQSNESFTERFRLIGKLKRKGLLETKEYVNLCARSLVASLFSFSDTLRHRMDCLISRRLENLYKKEGRAGCCQHNHS